MLHCGFIEERRCYSSVNLSLFIFGTRHGRAKDIEYGHKFRWLVDEVTTQQMLHELRIASVTNVTHWGYRNKGVAPIASERFVPILPGTFETEQAAPQRSAYTLAWAVSYVIFTEAIAL